MGGSKAKKRRSVASSKSRKSKKAKSAGVAVAGSSKTKGTSPAIDLVAQQGIVVDVDPEDDDEFIKTIVKIKKTQMNLNSRHASRITTKTPSRNVDDSDALGCAKHKLTPLTVEVLSIEAIFQKYGKYISVTNKSEAEASQTPMDTEAAALPESEPGQSLQEDAKNKSFVPTNTQSNLPSPTSINISQVAESELAVAKDEPSGSHPHDMPDELPVLTTVTAKPKKKKSRKSKRRVKIRIRKTPVGAANAHSSDISETTIPAPDLPTPEPPTSELPTEDTESPLLPKRVTLKKNLINQMLHRLTASRNPPPPLPCSDDIEIIEAQVVLPEVIQIDNEDGDGSNCADVIETAQVPSIPEESSELPNFASLIPKEELQVKEEVEDGFVMPKIEAITGNLCASPDSKNVDESDNSSDEDQAMEDDFLADPDFDPDEDSEESDNEVSIDSPEKDSATAVAVTPNNPLQSARPIPIPSLSSSSTTCETCNLRFLKATSYKIHMKECHNEYSLSEDEEQPVTLPPPATPSSTAPPPPPHSRTHFNCKICQLPFGSLLGLKIHTNNKHKESKGKAQGSPKPKPPELKDSVGERVPDPPQKPIKEKVIYVCSFPDCDLLFSSMQNMKIHKCLQHQKLPKKSIGCILCSVTLVEPAALLYHLKNSHPGAIDEEGYQEFERLGITTKEVTPHTNSVPEELGDRSERSPRVTTTCALCNISFQWEANLKHHMKLYHDDVEIVSLAAGGKKRKLDKRNANSSPLLAAALKPTSTSQNDVQRESLTESGEAEVIVLSDDDDDDGDADGGIQPRRVPRKVAGPKPSSAPARKKSFNTMCPYCTKSISSEDFRSHIETHANLSMPNKFSCPFSGCRETFNSFEEVQGHHKFTHQGKGQVSTTHAATLVHDMRRLSDPEGPCRTFICGVCDNVTFSSFKSLEEHCQLKHPETSKPHQEIQPVLGVTESSSSAEGFSSSTLAVTPLVNIGPTGSTYALRRVQTNLMKNHVSRNPGMGLGADIIDKNQGKSTMHVRPLARIGPMQSSYTITPVQQAVTGAPSEGPALEVVPLLIPSQFICSICSSRSFATRRELEFHKLVHQGVQVRKTPLPSKESFFCDECDLVFPSLFSRNQHLMSFHKSDLQRQCPICKVAIKRNNTPRHVYAVHKMWLCNCCPQVFKEEIQKRRHVQLHCIPASESLHGKNSYRCLECLAVRPTMSCIGLHYETMHTGGDKCTCVTCNIQLQRKNLKTHLELHQRETTSAGISKSGCEGEPSQSRLRELLISSEEQDEFPPHVAQVHEPKGWEHLPPLLPIAQIGDAHNRDAAETILPDPLQPDPLVEHEQQGESVHFFNPVTSFEGSPFDFEEVVIIGDDQPGESYTQNTGEIVNGPGGMFPANFTTSSCNYAGSEFANSENSYLSNEFEGIEDGVPSPVPGNPPCDPLEKGNIPCGLCPKRFPRMSNRATHIRQVHQNAASQACSICGEYYMSEVALARHIKFTHSSNGRDKTKHSAKGKRSDNNHGKLQTVHKSVSNSTTCQYCGMEFRSVMERRKHELDHFETGHSTDMRASESSTCTMSPSQFVQEQDGEGLYADEDGCGNPENVFIPMGMMMKTDVETPTLIGTFKDEKEEATQGTISRSTDIPQCFDEFVAML